jgi:hypothetical protein
MEFSEKRLEQIKNMPIVESKVLKSKDGKFVIHKTVITDIKPVKYYEVVLEKTSEEETEE